MSIRLKLMLFAFGLFIFAIALIEGTSDAPINWSETFRYDHSHPFGTKVLYEELNRSIFPKTSKNRLTGSLYDYFEKHQKHNKSLFLFIGSNFEEKGPALNKIIDFAKQGNDVFIAAKFVSQDFFDKLKIYSSSFNGYDCNLSFEQMQDDTKISVNSFQEVIKYRKIKDNFILSSIPKNAEILGNFHIQDYQIPNFVRVKVGEGSFYFHSEPRIFTNYFMLKILSFNNAFHAISYVHPKNILWYDGLSNRNEEETPLRVILANPPLRWAWYILLSCLAILLIFRSRREQKEIPIVVKPQNRTVEFAQTISSLYYERGTPLNMIQKKIEHFLFRLRKNVHLSTDDLTDSQFILFLSQRSGIKEEILLSDFQMIKKFQKIQNANEDMLKSVNHKLNQLTHKLQI